MIIREGTTDDVPTIARVHIRSWQQTYRGLVPQEYLDSLNDDLDSRIKAWRGLAELVPDRGALYVAEMDGNIIGFINVGPTRDEDLDSQQVGELGVLYLLEEHWGKGIGKALHDEGLGDLHGFGFKEAMLWVLDTNERTRRWYERQGWSADGAEKKDDRRTFILNEVRYRITL